MAENGGTSDVLDHRNILIAVDNSDVSLRKSAAFCLLRHSGNPVSEIFTEYGFP
jgi:hypothetical protein